MKQIIPFIIIAALIGGAMFFLNDDYQEAAFDPGWTNEQSVADWDITLFLENGPGSDREIGFMLEYAGLAEDPDIDALEVFVLTEYGSFFYQELDIEEFNKEIIYSVPCDFCDEAERSYTNTNIMLNWRQNGHTRQEYTEMNLYLEEEGS
ncbi:hypothetical protein MM300_14165 [Evansella sp. LMS18]|uniref:hypothetical protein n=1 Tax=Evansella sp. LMS18 TaxID=2924033 RepID=UPI0020D01BB8|nr:hypothetical protein [Evansella sp. LMS18]UTR09065.1 hypothetical protein MM300_14165 [Evansella sp. LMS18]